MISFEPELDVLRDESAIDPAAHARLVAIERRAIFSLYGELRTLLYAGVALIVAGVGLYLKDNLDRLGHGTIIGIIAFAAAGCYLWAFIGRSRSDRLHPSHEYLLLLGALLLSVDLGYAEGVYHWFGDEWERHLLILAVFHGATAYLFGSRVVLSLAITSLAGWIGVDREGKFLSEGAIEAGSRLLLAGAAVAVWRLAHGFAFRGADPEDSRTGFGEIFDHFVANLAMIGALVWVFNEEMELVGALILLVFATISIVGGIRTRRELFVLYGVIFAVIGFDSVVVREMNDEIPILVYLLVSTPMVIIGLFLLHRRWGRDW